MEVRNGGFTRLTQSAVTRASPVSSQDLNLGGATKGTAVLLFIYCEAVQLMVHDARANMMSFSRAAAAVAEVGGRVLTVGA